MDAPEMERRLKMRYEKLLSISGNVTALIGMMSGLIALGLDSTFLENPRQPDPASGRIFEHGVRGVGSVYLNQNDHNIVMLLFWIAGISLALFFVIFIAHSFLKTKKTN
jgi:hypothetical protein